MPLLQFGPNQICRFSSGELEDLLDPDKFKRRNPEWGVDCKRLCQFSWLVITENVELPGEPGARALPALFAPIDKEFGNIEPHERLFSPAVEAALFALLTAPWEDVTAYSDFQWRPFLVPWVYTLDDDLFTHASRPPKDDSLSWEPDFHEDEFGETVKVDERPQRLHLENDVVEKLHFFNTEFWQRLLLACASPVFAGPVQHFLVRAFATSGIDEFLSHITVIEAALGLVDDHSRRPKLPRNPGATARVAARLSYLLDDRTAGERYRELFGERSNFVHGRIMPNIPANSRLEARRLARRCVCELVRVVNSATSPVNRDAYLTELLRKSWVT